MSAAPAAGSYDVLRTTAGGRRAEYARLEAQADLSFADELPVLREAGLPGPLLELGAGTGAVTRRLRGAFPELPLLALDVDADMLRRGTAANLSVVADGQRLPLADGSVGAVLLRYVVQHLDQPVEVLREVHRVLRPGGVVVVTDVDDALWGATVPTYPDVAAVHARLAGARRGSGDRTVGRRLTSLLREAGFPAPRLRCFVTTNDGRPTADFEAHLGPGRLAPLVAAGDLSTADLALCVRRWIQFRDDTQAWVLLLGFTAFATRGPDAPLC